MHIPVITTHVQPTEIFFGRQFKSLPVDYHRRRRRHVRPTGVRTADQKVCGGYCVLRVYLPSPLLGAKSATDKTQTVCFCLTGHKYHHCCPPPPSMEVQLYLPPSMTFFKAPSGEPRRGGVREWGSNDPPPPRASQFPPTPEIPKNGLLTASCAQKTTKNAKKTPKTEKKQKKQPTRQPVNSFGDGCLAHPWHACTRTQF